MERDKATAGVEQNLWITCEEGEYTGVGKGRKIDLWYTLTNQGLFPTRQISHQKRLLQGRTMQLVGNQRQLLLLAPLILPAAAIYSKIS